MFETNRLRRKTSVSYTQGLVFGKIRHSKVETLGTHLPAMAIFDMPVETNSPEIVDPSELSIEIFK